jgi:hypothetical protein
MSLGLLHSPIPHDPDGYLWPHTYSTGSKNNFPFWQLFTSFRVLNFWGHFEGLNDVCFGLFGDRGWIWHATTLKKCCTSRIDLSDEVSNTPNRDHMQKLLPQKVDISTTSIGACKPFEFSSSRVNILDFIYFKKAFRATL